MFIQKTTAASIIREISTVLNYDINIMNEKGIIIASTNPERIDGFHEGAYKIINENLEELLVYYDGEYQGCRKGINLPILVDGQIIGVIGMTGEVSEITQYGRILKKMTEIMVMDISNIYQRSIEEHSKIFFMNGIIANNIDTAEIRKQLKKFRFNESSSIAVFMFTPSSLLEKHNLSNTIAINNGNIGIAVTQLHQNKLHNALLEISQKEKDAFFYISNRSADAGKLHEMYVNTENIYEYCSHANPELDNSIIYYDEHLINVKLFNMSEKDKESCIEHIFSNCIDEEKSAFAKFIKIYSKYNGSINRIADHLFIHKNTVQYKINKIYSKTGLDMRKSEDLFKLSLAAKLSGYK